jgi:hypothetical protein
MKDEGEGVFCKLQALKTKNNKNQNPSPSPAVCFSAKPFMFMFTTFLFLVGVVQEKKYPKTVKPQ